MRICRLLKGMKLNWMVFKSIIKDSKNINNGFSYDMVNEDGVIVDYAPATLAKFKLAVAGMQIVQFGIMNLKPRFVYDDLYLQLSEETQEFIKQHEMGHWTLHQNIILSGGVDRQIEMEFEADEFAATMVGIDVAIKGLRELMDILGVVSFDKKNYSTDEIKNRIEKLENLMGAK